MRDVLPGMILVLALTALAPESGCRAGESIDGMLLAPFGVHQGSFFYAALGVPQHEAAATLPAGETRWRVRTDHTHTQKGSHMSSTTLQETVRLGMPIENGFLGQFHTWLAVEAEYGVLDWLQLGARMGFGGWDEQQDHFYFTDSAGLPVVRYEYRDFYGIGATSRQDDIQDAVFKAKAKMIESVHDGYRRTLSAGFHVKLAPAYGRNLVDAGTTDLGLAFLGSIEGPVWGMHALLAGVMPVGKQTLFETGADADISPFAVASLAVVRRASDTISVGVQVQAATAAFGEIAFLDGGPVTVAVGVRSIFAAGALEVGGGAGLGDDTSADWQLFAAWSFAGSNK
jgi:hypothetical protein